jgi:muramoyltetrapeptide carboxypeptidase LdcA involved in peptidoglycan recycling
MAKNIVILILLAVNLVLARAVIRLENFHYAVVVGMCPTSNADELMRSAERLNCLHRASTRTNDLWHIYYALLGD